MNVYWQSWQEFAAMGGYGLYVWGSFGACAAAVAVEIAALRARRRALKRTAQRQVAQRRTGTRFVDGPHEAQG